MRDVTKHKSYVCNYIRVSVEPEIKYEGFGGNFWWGALCWWGAWGPGPLGPPLNPALESGGDTVPPLFGPGNESPMATKVVVLGVPAVIRFSIS